jgi:hypothetical protein
LRHAFIEDRRRLLKRAHPPERHAELEARAGIVLPLERPEQVVGLRLAHLL